MLLVLIYWSYYKLSYHIFPKVSKAPNEKERTYECCQNGKRENYSCNHEVENFNNRMARLIVTYPYNST